MSVDWEDIRNFVAYSGGKIAIVMVDETYGILYSKDWNTVSLCKKMSETSASIIGICAALTEIKPGSQLSSDVYYLSRIVYGEMRYMCLRRDWQTVFLGYWGVYYNDPETARLTKAVADCLFKFGEIKGDIEDSYEDPRRCLTPE
jgi:hypothetical protein